MLIDKIQNSFLKAKVFFSLLFVIGFSFALNKSVSLQENIFIINKIFTPIERFQYTIKNYNQLTDNLEQLEKEVLALKIKNRKLVSEKSKNSSRFPDIDNQFKYIAGNVLFFYPGLTATSFVVDKGFLRGIEKNMAVIDTRGVLGKVVKISQNVSLVITINDPSFRIGVKTSNGGGVGVVQFSDNGSWNVNHINDSDEFALNDTLYTSGYGGIFPKNIPFGIITKIKKVDFSYYPEVEVSPFANYKNPNHIFLVKNLLIRELNE